MKEKTLYELIIDPKSRKSKILVAQPKHDDLEYIKCLQSGESDAEYTDEYMKSRFEHERDHPKKFSRTMNEGEEIRLSVSARLPASDSESESSGTSPAPTDADDSELGGEEGWRSQ